MNTARKLPTFEEMYATVAALPEGQHGEILGPGWLRVMSRPCRWRPLLSRCQSDPADARLGLRGAVHVWVFDPDAASIEVYSPIDGRPTLIASARAPAVLPPFEARIDPGALLRRPG